MQCDAPVTLQSNAHGRRIGQRSIAAAIPHARHTHPAPQRPSRPGVECCRLRPRSLPSRPQRLEAGANSHALAENLPGHRRSIIVQRIQDAELQPVHSDSVREIVIKLLLRDRRLGHAESAKRSRRNDVGVHGTSQRAVVWDPVRPRGMHRHTPRNRRSPRRIRARIEVRGKVERRQLPLSRRARTQPHARRMPLGGRHHRFRPRIHHAHRPPQLPRGQRDKRLH